MDQRTADDERFGGLMQAAQAGDADAYVALLREITPRIRTMVWRRCGAAAPDMVEDLVQDVLLSIHVARASYDARRPFLPWLLAIVRNRLADGARRRGRHAAHEVRVEDLDVTFCDVAAKSPSEPLGDIGDIVALRNAVQALPPKQRDAIALLKLQGLSLKEAAAVTGMSVGALKVATHRAMAALRRILAPRETHGN
jgi:RNA polymerase sigma factor (sigma-70 family)